MMVICTISLLDDIVHALPLNVTSTLICDISKYVNTANTTESVIILDFEGIESNEILRQHSSQQIIDWDPISLGFLVYIDAVCRL